MQRLELKPAGVGSGDSLLWMTAKTWLAFDAAMLTVRPDVIIVKIGRTFYMNR
jgi:hypothetical protein